MAIKRGALDFPEEDEPMPVSNAQLGVYTKAAVVANSEGCAPVAMEILRQGGSAVDATIALMLCEGLCSMQNMGVGGGVCMTVYEKASGRVYSLDAREVAPLRAYKNMFKGDSDLAATGGLSIAVPGELMGYWEAHKRFGKLCWKDLFAPAINMCREGIPVSSRLGRSFSMKGMGREIVGSDSLRALLCCGGELPRAGESLRVPVLGDTLAAVAASPRGALELYNGSLTKVFVDDVQSCGGIITLQDMSSYKAVWSCPVIRKLRSGDVFYSSPAPCSGEVLGLIVGLLDQALAPDTRPNPSNLHKFTEAFKYAYALRAELGDEKFVDNVPVIKKMRSPKFMKTTRSKIETQKLTSSDPSDYGATFCQSGEDHGTINTVVIAENGDAVCATSTINTLFGSLVASVHTGIILNNEMDDFCAPGIVNSFGVYPSKSNFIEPGKRPVSSMCPTLVIDPKGDVKLAVGAAGGTHITTSTAQVIANFLWLGKNIKEAVDMPRIHHQLIPMLLKYEYGFSKKVIETLQKMGHRTKLSPPHSSVTAIARDSENTLNAIYDYRRGGSTAGI